MHENRHASTEEAKCYALCMFGDAMAWLAVYLRNQSGHVSQEDQAILDKLLERSGRVARKLERLDSKTTPQTASQ